MRRSSPRLAALTALCCSLIVSLVVAVVAPGSAVAAAPVEVQAGPSRALVTDVALPPAGGTWLLGSDGGVFAYGAPFLGSAAGTRPGSRAVDLVASPTGNGYAVVFADGTVRRFGDFTAPGDATTFGEPIVAGAVTGSGAGLWLFGNRGGVFAFGDARFHGSAANLRLGGPVVDAIVSPTGGGYRLVDSLGGVYAFGDATFAGSLPGLNIRTRVIAAAGTPTGGGYLLLGADGGVFAFGDATFPGAAQGNAVAGIAIGAGGRVVVAASTDPPRGVDGPAVPANSGTGRRVVYSNSAQRVWLVEEDGTVVMNVAVSGRRGVPAAGTYTVYSQSTRTWAVRDAGITMEYMTRFAYSTRSGVPIGFHAIPLRNGVPMQSFEQLGTYRSAGCVRMATPDAVALYGWARPGTRVVVLP